MRKLILLLLLLVILNGVLPTLSSIPAPPPSLYFSNSVNYYCLSEKLQFEINFHNIPQIFILSLVSVILLSLSYLQLCNHVRYVTFNTNLSICSMKRNIHKSPLCLLSYLSLVMLSLLLCECHHDLPLLFIIHESPNYVSAVDSTFKFSKILSLTMFFTSSLYIFSIAVTENACFLCLLIFQICCHSFTKNVANHTHCSGK